MIIDHIGVSVSDYDTSCRFFSAAHRPLHIAFLAENRDQVRAFYAAALGAGATEA